MDEGLSRQAAPGGAVSLGGALLDDDAVHELLQQLTVLARHTVLGAHSVSVTVAQGDRYRTSNCTGPEALAVDEAQYDQRGGPCLESMRVKRQLEISVGDGTDRWPRFDAAAREMGVAAVLSTPLLRNGGDAIGALNVYAATAGFADSDVRTTALIGEHATILVGCALALADSSQLNDQLRQAVATRETIGAAKGILMESQSCTRDQAFDILRRASQRENRKLRDIAEEFVLRVEGRAESKASRP
ncbi:MAG TPA: GAF and ANTAR domain-containing protein [Acidimicrobiales bacterium]|nr:GAF and ANTAR domain-containing protein [Acidimicrobiales bacterium]